MKIIMKKTKANSVIWNKIDAAINEYGRDKFDLELTSAEFNELVEVDAVSISRFGSVLFYRGVLFTVNYAEIIEESACPVKVSGI